MNSNEAVRRAIDKNKLKKEPKKVEEKVVAFSVSKSHRKKKKTHYLNVFFSFIELLELLTGFFAIIIVPWTNAIKEGFFTHDTAVVCYIIAIHQIFVYIFMNDKLLTNLRCYVFMSGNHPTFGWDFINKIICFDYREPFIILSKPWSTFMSGGCCASTRHAFNLMLFGVLGVLLIRRDILEVEDNWYGYLYFAYGSTPIIFIFQRIPFIPLYAISEYCDDNGEILSSRRMDESFISDGFMRNLMTRRFLAANGVDMARIAKANIIEQRERRKRIKERMAGGLNRRLTQAVEQNKSMFTLNLGQQAPPLLNINFSTQPVRVKKDGLDKNQSESECPICLLQFEVDDNITLLGCNKYHILHSECLASWSKSQRKRKIKPTCPLCRKEIDHVQSHTQVVTEVDREAEA